MEPIRGTTPIDDPSYRYQMPILSLKIEKSRTQLVNIVEIATAVERPADWLLHYIAKKAGVASFTKDDCVYIQGHPSSEGLRKSIYEFIEEVVLCPVCALPETTLRYTKSKGLYHRCAACGADSDVKESDFTKWINTKLDHLISAKTKK